MAIFSYDDIYKVYAYRENRVRIVTTQGEGTNESIANLTSTDLLKAPKFQLRDERGVISIPTTGAPHIQLAVTRPNDTEDLLDCDVIDNEQGIIVCPIRKSLTSIAGEVSGEIRLITANAVIKFAGINFYVYDGVSDNAAMQSEAFSDLIRALQKVVIVTGSGEQEGTVTVQLDDVIAANGTNPVASGLIYDALLTKIDDANGSVHTNHISNSAITENKLANGAVTENKLATNSVTNQKIKNSAVTTDKIDNASVTTDKIANGSVTTAKLAQNSVTENIINDGAVTTEKIDDGAITSAKILGGAVTVGKIGTGAVTTPKISNGAVTTEKIENGAVTTDKIGEEAVTDVELAPNAVVTSKILDSAVTTAKLANESVTEGKLAPELSSKINDISFNTITRNIYEIMPSESFDVRNSDVISYINCVGTTPYTDDYSTTLMSNSLSGNNKDKPSVFTISSVPTGGNKIVVYDVTANKEVIKSTSTHYIRNLIPNHIYTYSILNSNEKALASGIIKATGNVRMIEGGNNTFNIRDLGGWECYDGNVKSGTLKYGLIYRGGRLNGSSGNYGEVILDNSHKSYFKTVLGIRDEIDLRSDNELSANSITDSALGSGVDYFHKIINYYQGSLTSSSKSYAALIKRVARDINEGKPCYIHCASGADRTAQLCLMIEAICGVKQSDLDVDYELSSFACETDGTRLYRTRDIDSNGDWKSFISDIKAMEGDSLSDKIVRYLLRNGVTIDEINTIRFGLIDGNPAKLNSPYAKASVTNTLSNIIMDNSSRSTDRYQPFIATLRAYDMYAIKSVTITMGGNDVSNCYSNGEINIPIVTGNIVITGVAQSVQSYVKNYTLLSNSWSSGAQPITITGYNLTANTRVDVDITPTANAQLIASDCAGIYVEQNVVSDSVVLTAKYLGNVPTTDVTVQLTLTEVVRGD